MKYLIIRVIKQIKNDKRTLALILFAPLIVLTLLYFLLGNSNYTPKIAVYDMPGPVYNALKNENAEIIDYDKSSSMEQYLKDGKADAVLYIDFTGVHIKMLEASSKTQIVMDRIQSATKSMMQSISPSLQINISYVYESSGTSTFDTLSYVFLGVLSFFFVFVVAGMSLVRERSSQTLERFLMSPIKRWQAIVGYTVRIRIFCRNSGNTHSVILQLCAGTAFWRINFINYIDNDVHGSSSCGIWRTNIHICQFGISGGAVYTGCAYTTDIFLWTNSS